MKAIYLISLLSAINLSAANFRWTESFTTGWTDAGGSVGLGSPLGTLTAEVLDGSSAAQLTMTLEVPYSNLLVAWWRPNWSLSPWDQYTLSQVNVAYDVPASYIVTGQENLLKPFYWENNTLNQVWAVGTWSDPVEFTPAVPEVSQYASLAALGLLGFAAYRRLTRI